MQNRLLRFFIIVILSIFIAEAGIMFILDTALGVDFNNRTLFNALILTLVLFPALYFFLYNPMNFYLEERIKSELHLRELLSRRELQLNKIGKIIQEKIEEGEKLKPQDIHQTINTKAELELNIQRYKALVKNSSEGIFILDSLNYNIQEANDKFLAMLGYDEYEIVRLNYKDIAIVEKVVLEENLKRICSSEEVQCFIRQFKRKDGSTIEIEANASVVSFGLSKAILINVRDLTDERKQELALRESFEQLKITLEEMVNALMVIAEKRDPYTAGHQTRVADLACAIGKEMGFSKQRLDGLRIAGILHDIGKIYVPTDILNKPGRLSEMEMGIIKAHPEVGYEIINKIPFNFPVAEIVHQHHERIDGSGYPKGLKNDDILLEAKILGVADVVEAMASHRPYRPAVGLKVALDEIARNKGHIYDSKIVEVCLHLFESKGYDLELVIQDIA